MKNKKASLELESIETVRIQAPEYNLVSTIKQFIDETWALEVLEFMEVPEVKVVMGGYTIPRRNKGPYFYIYV